MEKELKNDKIFFKILHKPHCIIEYEVEVLPPLAQESYRKAVKIVAKQVEVHGFRKGKAPEEMVIKKFSHDIDKKWQEEIANIAYKECKTLDKTPLVREDAPISYKMHEHSKTGAKLSLSFETLPIPPSVKPEEFSLKPISRPEVNEEKVEETIRQAQLFFASWKEISDRSVQERDFIILDVDVLEPEEQRLFSNTRFEVSNKSMAKWMKELVIGKTIGDLSEGVSVPDESLSEEEKKQFSPRKVRLRIKAIEEAALPPLDDKFAKQIGVENVEQMRKKIKTLLDNQAEDHVKEKMREQVTDFLLKQHPFDLPQSVIEKEARFRFEQLMQEERFKQR
ncbi:MAG: hypothetical protein L0207_03810, partial [Chlamydiae bacterium]|nr:hypothetical protein [Chlamydiota bacterium]